ncbi:ubiquinone anaerobic biosynthesis accessory factor UbiT [Motilimonas pumila]|uniref:Ubiquinone biosynthesis accessory factor UbiT n=1 Tax=Motilimonas pumila TaxID=2303987 RepID=A0A418YK06_9GAMM|nr:SCP2 sterol-binding domain-containing protein [Motilimonas pumila]RJG51296.1 SCP2 domain-containing protein [Motilimonas pumila]
MLQHLHQELVSQAAQIFKLPCQITPKALQQGAIQAALNRLLASNIAEGDVDFLIDKWLHVHITDLDLSWVMSLQREKITVKLGQHAADVHFSADLNDLVLIAGRKEDPDTLFFQRRLHISGDTELGLEVKNLLDALELETLPLNGHLVVDKLSQFVAQGVSLSQQKKAMS